MYMFACFLQHGPSLHPTLPSHCLSTTSIKNFTVSSPTQSVPSSTCVDILLYGIYDRKKYVCRSFDPSKTRQSYVNNRNVIIEQTITQRICSAKINNSKTTNISSNYYNKSNSNVLQQQNCYQNALGLQSLCRLPARHRLSLEVFFHKMSTKKKQQQHHTLAR